MECSCIAHRQLTLRPELCGMKMAAAVLAKRSIRYARLVSNSEQTCSILVVVVVSPLNVAHVRATALARQSALRRDGTSP